MPRHILIKLAKIKDKEKLLKVAREKRQIIYKGIPIRLSADHSAETLQARREWQDIFKVMKGKSLQRRLLFAKISFSCFFLFVCLFFFCLLTALLMNNSQIIKFTLLKCPIQWSLVYSRSCITITTILLLHKETSDTVAVTSHPALSLAARNYQSFCLYVFVCPRHFV